VNLFSGTTTKLENALNVASLKQKVISSNVANVDTPNYKSKEVSFQTALMNAMENNKSFAAHRTNEKHIQFSNQAGQQITPFAKVISRPNSLFNHNGNNVDMDYEMAELAKNQLWYNALTERINGKFNSLRTVINDGR